MSSTFLVRWLAPCILVSSLVAASPDQPADWSGNFARDPGFEEDFVNLHAEPHVLSFKGDWFYNQKDLAPDYWTFTGGWKRNAVKPHGGSFSLVLDDKATAAQDYKNALYQEGGSAWGAAPTKPITVTKPERYSQPWQATVWCRGGGTLSLCGVTASAKGGADWEKVTVECPPDKCPPDMNIEVKLIGPGEFDDLDVREKLPPTPNLLPNGSFETVDKEGYPVGWSQQKKFDWIGPTYYVWTDWNHCHEENRGRVGIDPLIFSHGKQSLRFDVYPGDEKFVQSDLIALNQDQPNLIEVSAWVMADRAKLIDIRCVSQDGVNLPCYYPIQPEYSTGGTATFGNGTFGWRHIRKCFSMPFNTAVKGIKVRLAARGFNGHILDDSGTRSYCLQAGTVWWDNVRVIERTSTEAELKARNVVIPPAPAAAKTEIADASLDLGERLFGDNQLTLSFVNPGAADSFRAKLSTVLPGDQPVVTESAAVQVATNARGTLQVPYRIGKLVGDIKQQGFLKLEVFKGKQLLASNQYAFNTWPVVADFDLSRHYSLPEENPMTYSVNLGVASATLAKVAKIEIELKRPSDGASLGTQTVTDLKKAFEDTIAALPAKVEGSYEFLFPIPNWWTDRTNLLIYKVDLGKLKTWPHDQPTRDTVMEIRGLDSGGKVLFSDTSEKFCRMAAPPRQEAIKEVKIREDGALLINGKPRFITGATHQQQRLMHTPEIIGKMGMMGHRLFGGDFAGVEGMWTSNGIYAIQMKPVSGMGTTEAVVDLPPDKRTALEEFVKKGGMQSVVSINTGGWETTIPDTPEAREKHQKLNDWIRQTTGRPIAWSSSGAFNAWNISHFPYYDMVHAETEMWGPMDFNVIFTPYMKELRKAPSTWVYLPQLYENTPYERYRFETYENIIRGSCGVSMIQGIGDPTFNRGLAGELRYLEEPLNSTESAPAVTFEPNVSHQVRKSKGKLYILATNCGPIIMGRWSWNTENKQSGRASHEGDSINRMWQRPGGVRMHAFRGLPMPEMVKAGDKIVQYVWLDPKETPEWVMFAVRGNGRFSHCGLMGKFDYEKFRTDYGNIFMYSELEHSVWHEINWIMDAPTYDLSVKLMGKAWTDGIKTSADSGRATVDKIAYQAANFHSLGDLPAAGKWVRMELDAGKAGLVGKLVDGFAYLSKNGRALWDYSVLERDGKPVRVFCEDSVGIDRSLLPSVKIRVPGLKAGAKVKALFEDRTIKAEDGGFTDDFVGEDTYGQESEGVAGDMFGFVKDDNREVPRMMPSGYGYSYGPTAVHIYEIEGM
jgi:hypothetical protein